jgi:hypothetical protein
MFSHRSRLECTVHCPGNRRLPDCDRASQIPTNGNKLKSRKLKRRQKSLFQLGLSLGGGGS